MANSNEFIKKAYSESEYTPQLIQELKKCQEDPIYFIKNYVYVQHPTKGRVLFRLYDYQQDLVNAAHTNSRLVVLAARQLRQVCQVHDSYKYCTKAIQI